MTYDAEIDSTTTDDARLFAADLRTLRVDAGNPTLHALSASTGVSKSVISDAFAGKRLPTENTVSQLAKTLGANPQEWLARRRTLDPRFGASPSPSPQVPVTPEQRRITMRTAIVAVASAAIASAALTSGVWAFAWNLQSAASAPNALPFETGVDPMATACRNDAVLAAYEERLDGVFFVEMLLRAGRATAS